MIIIEIKCYYILIACVSFLCNLVCTYVTIHHYLIWWYLTLMQMFPLFVSYYFRRLFSVLDKAVCFMGLMTLSDIITLIKLWLPVLVFYRK